MKRWNGNVMNLKHFHDFYYLEALRANLTMAKSAKPELNFRKAFLLLENDVNQAFETLCERMALHIYVYLWTAALGEATFAHGMCDQQIAEQQPDWSYPQALEYFPSDNNVAALKEIYSQEWHSGGFGGEAWLSIVEGMELYGKVSHATFIDHAVDLEHNGGNVFDKTSADACGLDCYGDDYNRSDLKFFLDLKFNSDILNENSIRKWVSTAENVRIEVSRPVYTLVLRYHNIVEYVRAVTFLRPTLNWLSAYTVDWDYNELTLEPANGGLRCENCGDTVDEDYCHYFDDMHFCDYCYDKKITSCQKCNEDCLKVDTQTVKSGEDEEEWCDYCVHHYAIECEKCATLVDEKHNTVKTEDDYTVCLDCSEDTECEYCEKHYYHMDDHDAETHSTELPIDADGVFEFVEAK